ncbi:MAG TPA: hypothetical protein VMT32_01040 [Bryobacteraceae bacterium]|nr:hypothetical protein [Bryobacteraceae bacterium]
MIGMSFFSFLVLLGIGVIVAAVSHFVLRYRFLDGLDSFFAKIALGWFGAWLGSPVFGYWWYKFENIYIVPAILGSITVVLLNVVAWKAMTKVFAPKPAAEKGTQEFKAAA